MTTSERFWKKVDKKSTEKCWLWKSSHMVSGYGAFAYKGVMKNAHRIAWILTNGEIGSSQIHVCHKCDVKLCVNPNHLFLGTAKDNIQDAMTKGRIAYGERCASSKLTSTQVIKIRSAYDYRPRQHDPITGKFVPKINYGLTQQELANRYCVDRKSIGNVVNLSTWRSI